ncbi:hypothetical protein JHW43_008953 [Diplocarpon mali]|nr:hypothetical protein JHW43_008953 [Diplocarpon mali]
MRCWGPGHRTRRSPHEPPSRGLASRAGARHEGVRVVATPTEAAAGGNAPGLTDRPDRCPFPPPAVAVCRVGSPDGPAVPGRVRRADETVDGGEMRVAGMGVVLRGDRRAKALVLRRPRRPGWCVPVRRHPGSAPEGPVPGPWPPGPREEGTVSGRVLGSSPRRTRVGLLPAVSRPPGPGHLSGSFSRPVEPEPEPEPAPKSRRRLFGKDTPNLCETVSAPASPRHTGLCPPPSRLRPASYPPLIRL